MKAVFLVIVCSLSLSSPSLAAELVLSGPGVTPAPIIVSEPTTPSNLKAAEELAVYLEKITGARPEVLRGEPQVLPERAIWVGVQRKLKELFPNTNLDLQQREEILIAANDRHLVIAGRDRWDPDHPVVTSPHGNLDHQFEYGTVNAVYTFLQDRLGVRWLWPGEDGEDVPRQTQISLSPFEYRYQPPLFLRRGVQWWLCRPASRGKLSAEWGRRQRVYLDASNNLLPLLNEGHAFDTWWDRFHAQHPDYFAMQPDGTRSGFPEPDRVKMCLSNPAVADEWVAEVGRLLEKNPTHTFFNASENDNHVTGYCVCPNCLAWDSPRAPKYRLYWKGMSEERPAMSDRQVRFANTVARKLRERYPDNDYKVVIYAYGPSASAPIDVRPEPNVLVAHVPNMWDNIQFQDRWISEPATNAQQISDWSATGTRLVWRPNLTGTGGLYQGLPDVPFTRAIECFQHVVVKNRASGVGLAFFANFWPTQGPLYYVLTQLTWNPQQDPRRILDDYYQRGFGPAADTLKDYWSLMEATRNKIYDGQLPFPQGYNAAFFTKADALLKQAEGVVAGEAPVYARRVAHVRMGLDFSKEIIATRILKDRYEESGKKDEAIATQLRAKIEELTKRTNGSMDSMMGPVIPSLFLDRWQPEVVEKNERKKDLE